VKPPVRPQTCSLVDLGAKQASQAVVGSRHMHIVAVPIAEPSTEMHSSLDSELDELEMGAGTAHSTKWEWE
jgi:hypothetical protein